MKIALLFMTLMIAASGCVNRPEIVAGPTRAADTYLIELFEVEEDDLCVRKTRTKVKNCSSHQDDRSCNVPQDQIIWVWKKPNIAAPFKVAAKPGNTSPFDPDGACTGTGSVIVCRIKADPGVDVFDYDIVVNPGTAQECTYDPRILIY